MKFNIDWGVHALFKLVEAYKFRTVLDIGSGDGEHKRFLEYFDKEVTSVDFDKDADYIGDFIEIEFDRKFDAIWCSHVLEHQRNVGLFLEKCYSLLNEDGVIAVIVPHHKPEMLIAGHLTCWGPHLLCYNMIFAGFDCFMAKMLCNHEIALLVKKAPSKINPQFRNSVIGEGEDPIETVSEYFPMPAFQGAELVIPGGYNWGAEIANLGKPVEIIGRHVNVQRF